MIKIDISKCTGCRMCETSCSFFHTGQTSRLRSRIRVLHIYETGIDGPVVCQQCRERYCMVCPVNAIAIGDYGEVVISPTTCIQCNKCVKACPIGAIEFFNDIYYVCDLCGGSPKCVENCSEGAIYYDATDSESVSLEEFYSESKRLNVSEKQANFIVKSGKSLRKRWRKENA